MHGSTHRWSLAQPNPALVQTLVKETGHPPLLLQCLLNRGLTSSATIQAYLEPKLRDLQDPFLLPDMDAAVDRLVQARLQSERLVIFGDYDVDGVTSTAILREALSALGWRVDHYLPHRLDEGYGLGQDAVENCLRKFPCSLLLAVDCGSTAVDPIAWLRQKGVDVIVLDHHQLGPAIPETRALVNPQRLASGTASGQELCSAGLAFKLAHAVVKRGRQLGWPEAQAYDLRPLLDLVALGTIADLVPLTGENRVLVNAGLQRLNGTQRPGLQALITVAGIHQGIGVYEVGYQLGPRLNAAGRLENADQALSLLTAPSLQAATPLAQALDARNRERQEIERQIAEQAIALIRPQFDPAQNYVIVEGQSPWHVGVVGIVASRVLREFHRPTLILGGDGQEWRGSGRSIAGFDLAAALQECSDLLLRHGGHAMAAGLSLHPEQLPALRQRLNTIARRVLHPEQLSPVLRIDAEVCSDELTLELPDALSVLEPVGQGNPAVHLLARNLVQTRPAQRLGKQRQHLKLWVQGAAGPVEVVWWNAPPQVTPSARLDLAFAAQVNTFMGRRSLQLKLLDWRAAG